MPRFQASVALPSASASSPYWWTMQVRNYTGILSGRSWVTPDGSDPTATPVFLTYSFQRKMTEADDEAWTGSHSRWRPFSSKDKADARAALKQWGAASGIKFLEAKGDRGDIQFSWFPQKDTAGLGFLPTSDSPSDQWDYVSGYSELSGNVYLDLNERSRFTQDPAFKKYVLLHEIGHALGLKQSFDESFTGRVLAEKYDDVSHTVMAYLKENQAAPTRLKHFDIQAIRKLYGSPNADGKQVASWHWDAKHEVLTQIGKATAGVLWGTNVTDNLYGGAGNDRLHGMVGDDLSGGLGSDILIGGPGRDSFRFDVDPRVDLSFDTILDFDVEKDVMLLSTGIFKTVGPVGPLAAKAFALGTTAKDNDARILFDSTGTKGVYYDADGMGPMPAMMIAKLESKNVELPILASHFLVV